MPVFREWILNNAETACYKHEQKILALLCSNLVERLTRKTNDKQEASVGKMLKVVTFFFKSVKKVMAS